MPTPLLSIGIIFRNDIRCLERCLQSMQELRRVIPCQLVMADTGSTDGSREVAARYADVLIDFAWIDDFAAARNAVLDHCTGEWYLTVDSDEWMDENFAKEMTVFLRSPQASQSNMIRLMQRNFTDTALKEYSDSPVARMGRRRKGKLRYKNPIHELLYFTDKKEEQIYMLPRVILNHDGYLEVTRGAREAKRHRNMVLLRAEHEKEPHDLRTLLHCINSSETEAERRKFVSCTLEELKKQKNISNYHSKLYQKCVKFYFNVKEYDNAIGCLVEWQAATPGSALYRLDGEWFFAEICYRQKKWEEALVHAQVYLQAIADVDSGNDYRIPDRVDISYDMNTPSYRTRVYVTLFDCLCKLDRMEEAGTLLASLAPEEIANRNSCGFLT